MKELSIEEKARRYDKALTKARNIVNSINVGLIGKDSFEAIFPELKESEDERIRKSLIDMLKNDEKCYLKEIAWLEKQSEQKSAWSEEDETTKNNISHIIREYDKISKRENQPCWYIGDCLLWMQYIKDRVQPQPKQEWSEEDDKMYKSLGTLLNEASFYSCPKCVEKILNWLKSLKERYTWKPSDEQMVTLEYYMHTLACNSYKETLFSLYQDLKKLREEQL